jgi:hypothetical protein
MREHHDLNYVGETLLTNALLALGRARMCREIIQRDGILLTNRAGLPRKHPLASIEVQSRQLVHSIFKMLHIDLRGGEFI